MKNAAAVHRSPQFLWASLPLLAAGWFCWQSTTPPAANVRIKVENNGSLAQASPAADLYDPYFTHANDFRKIIIPNH